MRTDNIGMFWQDLPTSRKHGERILGPMPPIPETGWRPPRDFPNIENAPIIGLDVETYDPQLKTNGPGWARRRHSNEKRAKSVPEFLHPLGSLVGVSVAAYGKAWYFPIRHTIHPETNLEPNRVLAWLRHILSGQQPKVGTNLAYDVGWLEEEGVPVNGPLLDISFAEALLTETGRLSLEAMAQKYLFTGKETNHLYRWCSQWYGGSEKDQRKNIWRAPPSLVGPYAEGDALLPMQILEQQKSQLEEQGLYDLFDMECRLTRLMLAMRHRGVRVDLDRAESVDKVLTDRIHKAQHELDSIAGTEVNVNIGDELAIIFDKAGLDYPLTPKTRKPSFRKEFLDSVEHPVADIIREVRRCRKLRDTFVRSYIMDANVGGRIYCQFHQTRNEGFGTRSGRFSSSHPNLQNIPSRDPELAPLIRSIFIPEEGSWLRYDYSQIEYRFLLHYAEGEGAEQARQSYFEDPDINYHSVVKELLKIKTGRVIAYKPTKNINFGLIYGMGFAKLCRELQLTPAEGQALFNDYHASVPYVRSTMEATTALAQEQGYIQTILGRRSRFDLWEPKKRIDDRPALPFEKALYSYGSEIQRAGLHKAVNRRLQGSAADLIKLAMLVCFEEGYFEGEQLPLLTVHDELDFSVKDLRDPTWGKIRDVMETVLELRIPIKVEVESGPNWGTLKKIA